MTWPDCYTWHDPHAGVVDGWEMHPAYYLYPERPDMWQEMEWAWYKRMNDKEALANEQANTIERD